MNILLEKNWYRIPISHAPKRKADYIVFYQPSLFGKNGSCIRYYGKIKDFSIVKRKEILPDEYDHPRINEDYYKIKFKNINRLSTPIRNRNRMRISFGFTTLSKFIKAKDITQLFDVIPIEEIVSKNFKKFKINASREHIFYMHDSKRYRLDFVVFCKKGPLNIECDGEKWHSIRSQKLRDIARDRTLKKAGWTVLRLKEKDIVNDIEKCMKKVREFIKKLGGEIINAKKKRY